MKPIFFTSQKELRKWFIKNHSKEKELVVGYYKKSTNKPSVDWPQSVDEAICFGWIDGIRNSLDQDSYQIRFTPRNPKSHWSAVNIKKAEKLIQEGKMFPAGLAAFKKMDPKNSKQTSYEKAGLDLDKLLESEIKKNKNAWDFYRNKLAASYKKQSINWIMSAKKEETKQRRLKISIDSCKKNEKIPALRINRNK